MGPRAVTGPLEGRTSRVEEAVGLAGRSGLLERALLPGVCSGKNSTDEPVGSPALRVRPPDYFWSNVPPAGEAFSPVPDLRFFSSIAEPPSLDEPCEL